MEKGGRIQVWKATLSILGLSMASMIVQAQNVQLTDGWFEIDGKREFLKCVGYETSARPGQHPSQNVVDLAVLESDLIRIRDAGFNVIRTWGAPTAAELTVIENVGLKVILGIWVAPDGPFSQRGFLLSASLTVGKVLAYSANSPAVIGYLIMNEPPLDNMRMQGAGNAVNLWNALASQIKAAHPGAVVSMSGATIHDFMSYDQFDYLAYNAYVYNPVTYSGSHGFAGYLGALRERNADGRPMIITEYGLSISPSGSLGPFGYGGNTPEQQAEGVINMYRGLIDAGATGGCVFQYHDGWWKAQDASTQDDSPEEWFGLHGFTDIAHQLIERPAWSAISTYNKGIIVEPRNGSIHSSSVPIDLYVTDDVAQIQVFRGADVLAAPDVLDSRVDMSLDINRSAEIEDVVLGFRFLDGSDNVLKEESISILLADPAAALPSLTLGVSPTSFSAGGNHNIDIQFEVPAPFVIESQQVDLAFHPHIGFDPGIHAAANYTVQNGSGTASSNFLLPGNTPIATFGAGLQVSHGTFSLRIHDEVIGAVGDWAEPLMMTSATNVEDPIQPTSFAIRSMYPNPASGSVHVDVELHAPLVVRIEVIDLLGRRIQQHASQSAVQGLSTIDLDVNDIAPGLYFVRIHAGDRVSAVPVVIQ